MPAVDRRCAQCGAPLPEKDPRKRFCSKEPGKVPCKVAYHNLALVRSQALLPLLQVWRGSRLKGQDKALGRFAFREACAALIDRANAEDRASGRSPVSLVQSKLDQGWRACDMEPRQKASPQPWEA